MKKLIMSVVTACLVCLSCMGSAVSADSSQMNDIQLLSDLGVIGEETKAELNKPMQRIAFVELFSSIENTKNASVDVTASFTDVDFSSDYGDAFAWLYLSGAISDGEFFYPEDNITFEQAVKMMVSALGYRNEAEVEGGYPKGYINIAGRLDLLDKVNANEFNVYDACMLYRNALDAMSVAIRNKPYEENGSERPMLERYYNVRYRKGRMTKNTLTTLLPELSNSKMTVAVEKDEYVCNSRYDDLIGQSVEIYYKVNTVDENEVVGIYPTNKNIVKYFESETDTSYSDFVYRVYEEDGYEVYEISRSVDVIYNGRIYDKYTKDELLPQNGDVTLVDSEGDDVYETVIINAYEIYIAGNGTGDGIICDRLGKSYIDLSEDIDYIIRDNGVEIDFSKIEVDNLLEIRKSKDETDKLIQIDVYKKMVSGLLDGIEDAQSAFKVNSVKYEVTPYLQGLIAANSKYIDKIELGKAVTLYLDRNGMVGYITAEDGENVFYTYLRKIFVEAPQGEDKVYLRIILPDGTWTSAIAAERIVVDEVKKKESDFITYVSQGNIKAGQPIKCKLNKDGEVVMIETLEKYEGAYSGGTYKRPSRCFDGYFAIANQGVVFVVPGVGFEQEESMYEIRNAGYFTDGVNYTVDAFEMNEALVADVIVVRGNGKNTEVNYSEPFTIVKNVFLTENDGEVCVGVETIGPTGEATAITKDSSIEFVDRLTGKYHSFSQLTDGDLVRFIYDMSGNIINGERLLDMNKFKQDKTKGAYSLNPDQYRSGVCIRGGYAYAKYEDIVAMTWSAQTSPDNPAAANNLVVYSMNVPQIMVYDLEDETIREGSISDIVAYKDTEDANTTSFLYMQSIFGSPKYAIIYK